MDFAQETDLQWQMFTFEQLEVAKLKLLAYSCGTVVDNDIQILFHISDKSDCGDTGVFKLLCSSDMIGIKMGVNPFE